MKNFRDYLSESEEAADKPVAGDTFAINIREECLIESVVVESRDDGVVIAADEGMMRLLESYGYTFEENCMECGMMECGCGQDPEQYGDETDAGQDPGEYDYEGDMAKDELMTMIRSARKLIGMLDNDDNMPEWTQKKINKATDYVDTASDYISSKKERGVMEQSEEDSPVARATLHRIMMRHPGMLAQHGPERVMKAVDDVADLVGDMDDIGTSDISGWVNMVQEILDSLDQNVTEGPVGGEIDDTRMNDQHKEFYKRNPHFKRNNRDRVDVGHGTQLATRVDPAKTSQVQRKPITPFGINEAVGMMIKGYATGGIDDQDFADQIAAKTGGRVAYGGHGSYIVITYPTTQDRARAAAKIRKMFPDIKLFKTGGNMNTVDESGVAEGSLNEAATMASVSKLLRHIERHNPTWFDDYGMGEVEDTVVDMAEQGTFSGMTVVDAASLVGQELESLYGADGMNEAEYQGRKVPLGKPMRGDVKKSKVYVKNPQGNVVKVNFGDPNMKIKKSNPDRRKNFRARHNCDNPGPRHKARYWSCRAW